MSKPKLRRRVTNPTNSPFASKKAVVQQHLAAETDINGIIARAKRGIPPTSTRGPGSFVDLSDTPEDLTEAFQRVEKALDAFESLPALARQELGNDPRRLLQADEAFLQRHGMLPKPPASAPQEPAKPPQAKPRTGSKAAPSSPPEEASDD